MTTAVNKQQNLKQELERGKNNKFAKDVIEFIPQFPKFMLYKALPWLTRLPIIEDHYLNTLQHHRHRYLKALRNTIEGNNLKLMIYVTQVDVDQYHATFDIVWKKPLTANKVRTRLNHDLKKHFGQIPLGTIFKLKRTSGQVLIPSQIVTETV